MEGTNSTTERAIKRVSEDSVCNFSLIKKSLFLSFVSTDLKGFQEAEPSQAFGSHFAAHDIGGEWHRMYPQSLALEDRDHIVLS